jgi:cyclopropane-fatty-acyl-phospholipid synthase
MKKNEAGHLTIPVVANGHDGIASNEALNHPGVSGWERWVARKILALTGNPPVKIILWNGEGISTSKDSSTANLIIRDRAALYLLMLNPCLHFGDLYSSGRIFVDGDICRFLESTYTSLARAQGSSGLKWLWNLYHLRPRSNTVDRSRDNIHHHYDIGNDFYSLWLDSRMQYTCAYFPDPDMDLERAQVAKMDHIARKLQLKAGDSVVEAGCGWGGLARHLASRYGVSVRAYNISHEQIVYARQRAKAEGLSGHVEYIEDDYRNISGTYDVFVSVGMLEHVGLDHYPDLGEVIDRSLTDGGRGLIHSIGRDKPQPINAWIEKRIFPGSYPPTLSEMMTIFESREFSVLDVENLRLHYAKTLDYWLTTFERHAEKIERMFDDSFVRAWRLYLAGSRAAFVVGTMQLFQLVFTRAGNNHIPWSRSHLYS